MTGLYEAQYGSSRVLVITGQAETAFYGKGLAYVHEAEKQVPMLASVCRRVESPAPRRNWDRRCRASSVICTPGAVRRER